MVAKFSLAALAVLLVIVLGGAGFLAMWTIPAPTTKIEKVLPDGRFAS